VNSTVFFNFSGRDFPDYSKKAFDSLAVVNGKVRETGFALETMSRYFGFSKVDLKGKTVFPAFADAHVHFLNTALMLSGCDLSEAGSLKEVFERISEHIKRVDSDWIFAWNLDETRLTEKRLPTVSEIDRIDSRKKIWISRIDLHSAVPNSAAFAWAKKMLPEAKLENGRFRKRPYYFLSGKILGELSKEEKIRALDLARRLCFSKGVATVHALEGGEGVSNDEVQTVADFFSMGSLHGVIYHQTEDPTLVLKNGWNRIGGCLFVDGSFGSRTAALNEPYTDEPSNSGEIYRDKGKIEQIISMCAREKLQLAMHAIGDRAISIITSAHDWGAKTFGIPPLRHRVEHFELPDNASIIRARNAELLLSVQPTFEIFWGGESGMYAKRLGKERAAKTNPFKTFLDFGFSIAGGSDSPVTPIDPMLGIHGFLNHPNPEERIDLNNALAAFIFEPHRFSGEHATRGKLEKNFSADFVCLSEDPFLVHPTRVRDIKVESLYICGEKVF